MAIFTLAAFCLQTGCSFSPLHKETRNSTHAHQPNSPIQIESTNGSITLTQEDREDVEIVAHLRATSEERLKATDILSELVDGNKLYIHVNWPEGKRHSREGCSFEVKIPDAMAVILKTSNGNITTSDLGGAADLKTSNGSIDVKNHHGSLLAVTSNGNIIANDIEGEIDTKTSNGSITIQRAPGIVKSKTSNGKITLSMKPQATGPIDLKTSNGSVEVSLGTAFVGTLSASTSNGSIDTSGIKNGEVVSSSKTKAKLKFGEAAQTSTVQTSNGSIRISSN